MMELQNEWRPTATPPSRFVQITQRWVTQRLINEMEMIWEAQDLNRGPSRVRIRGPDCSIAMFRLLPTQNRPIAHDTKNTNCNTTPTQQRNKNYPH